MNRRDLLLNEMGISQWVLAKPQVLKGNAQIRLDKKIKLVVICEEDHQNSHFFADLLRALGLQKSDYSWVDSEQSQRLVFEHSPLVWKILGEEQAVKIANQTAWENNSWKDLAQSQQKRKLWQQMEAFSAQLEKTDD
ncbi:DNA polymerase III psi subunit protein [Mannheimia varigena USDA-ARS-USMARC-1388]|uniref:DNA polymerase III subunit psi n=1 Tax=Mannheimia varigena TaxID=85404 RepID=UPI0003E3A34A|nr:DNA polymerase III subunit psi [Mannheimia varigena]AHG78945.1 DNA polymerase III psi subunit protein [Mannheimia varigena USDA-ARS-USMARC-1388]